MKISTLVFAGSLVLGHAAQAATPARDADDPHSRGEGLSRILGTRDLRALNRRAFAIGTAEKLRERAQRQALSAAGLAATPAWSLVGPSFLKHPSYTPENGYADSGLIANVAFHPTDANTIWVATAGGGVWKTTNGGSSWIPTMDDQLILPIGAVAVARDAPNRVYAGSGCGDYSNYTQDFPGLGLLISTDGGGTWRTSQTSPGSKFYDLMVVDSAGPNVVLAATEVGVRRSTDGGDTWGAPNPADRAVTLARGSDPSIVYAGTFGSPAFGGPPSAIYKSTNGGISWTELKNGLPGTDATRGRPRIAVSPSDATRVYVLFSDQDGATLDLARSTDGGTSFTALGLMSKAPPVTILGNQGTTMIGLGVDTANPNTIVAGGFDTWKSTDGGDSWTQITAWTGPTATKAYVHADVHSITYRPNGNLFVSSDGGLFRSTNGGTSFQSLNQGLATIQFNYICQTPANVNTVAGGAQDNASAVRTPSGEFLWQVGGDGQGCFVHGTDASIIVGSAQENYVRRSTDGGLTFGYDPGNYGLAAGVGEKNPDALFSAPIRRHPVAPATAFTISKKKFWQSTDAGASWTTPSGVIAGVNGQLQDFHVLPTDGSRILLLDAAGNVFESTDGGATFPKKGTISGGRVTTIRYDRSDVKRMYAVDAVVTAGSQRLFLSTDSGATWGNLGTGLPDVPLFTIEQDVLDGKTLHVGTYIGVYRSTDSGATWARFGTGLPNVMVRDIAQLPSGRARIGTFGRSIWEIDPSGTAPALTAAFTFAPAAPTAGSAVTFTDQSTGSPTSWAWDFGDGGTSTSQNPAYTFKSAGTFTVTLTVGNGAKTVSTTKSVTVTAATGACTTGGPNLCLNANRFRVTVGWKNPYDGGTTGVGTAVALTSDSGYFWFFGASNIELVIKILDGRTVNGKFWVLYGALSDVEYTITITDTLTGFVKPFFNPGKNLASVADINALPGARPDDGNLVFLPADYGPLASLQLANGGGDERKAALATGTVVAPPDDASREPLAACAAAGDTLCLNASRFQLRVAWRNYNDGSTGSGVAVKLTDDSGYFWFFNSANVELMLKVLDGRAANGKFWVFYGALSDVEYTITVTDTATDTVKTYFNPARTLGSRADISAF